MLFKKFLKHFIYKKQLLKIYNYYLDFIYRIKTKGIYDKKDLKIIEQHEENICLKTNQIDKRTKLKAKIYNINQKIDASKFYKIDINKFVGFEGNHFLSGSDPLVETARELVTNPKREYNETFLYKYFQDFQPKSIGEFYNLKKSNKLYSIKSTKGFHPWSNKFPIGFRAGFFGPKDNSSIKFRMIRLKNLVNNIEKYGYVPYDDDIIEGYILKKKKDYRFLVTAGHHRVSVMSLMHSMDNRRFKYLAAKFKPYPPNNLLIYEENDILKWPAVKNEFISKDDALEMFYKFF